MDDFYDDDDDDLDYGECQGCDQWLPDMPQFLCPNGMRV